MKAKTDELRVTFNDQKVTLTHECFVFQAFFFYSFHRNIKSLSSSVCSIFVSNDKKKRN